MTPCHWCGAAVWDHTAEMHAAWHRANDLHAADCELLRNAQRGTGAFLPPQTCSCGLTQQAQPLSTS